MVTNKKLNSGGEIYHYLIFFKNNCIKDEITENTIKTEKTNKIEKNK
jgi:hypothetical protein